MGNVNAMTSTRRNIIPRKQAENTQTTQYTAVNCRTIIETFTATNTTSAPVTFSVNLVALSGTPGASNLVLDGKSIAAHQTYHCPELIGQALEPGGFVSTLAGSASALTISATGNEIT